MLSILSNAYAGHCNHLHVYAGCYFQMVRPRWTASLYPWRATSLRPWRTTSRCGACAIRTFVPRLGLLAVRCPSWDFLATLAVRCPSWDFGAPSIGDLRSSVWVRPLMGGFTCRYECTLDGRLPVRPQRTTCRSKQKSVQVITIGKRLEPVRGRAHNLLEK